MKYLVSILVFLGCLSLVRAQDSPDDDVIRLVVRGQASCVTSQAVLKFIVRSESNSELAEEVAKEFAKKIDALKKDFDAFAPTTSLSLQLVLGGTKIHPFTAKHNQMTGGITKDAGTTCSQYLTIHIGQLDSSRPAQRSITKLLEKLAEHNLTGMTEEVDIISIELKTDLDLLHGQAYQNALVKAKSEAAAIASFSNRKLGKALTIKEVKSSCNNLQSQSAGGVNYFELVYPNMPQWSLNLLIELEVDVEITYQLQD